MTHPHRDELQGALLRQAELEREVARLRKERYARGPVWRLVYAIDRMLVELSQLVRSFWTSLALFFTGALIYQVVHWLPSPTEIAVEAIKVAKILLRP